MKEVTVENFAILYPEIEASLKNAKFIAVDTEFSALNPLATSYNSLFDSASDRYKKLRKTVEVIIPLQIGITAFSFDRDKNSYRADCFTFYLFPRSNYFINKKFVCQASSLQFLSTHGFDFNKLIYDGVSFLNRQDEVEIKKKISEGFLLDSDIENVLDVCSEEVGKWLPSAKVGDALYLKDIKGYKHNQEILYFIHKSMRERYLFSYITDKGIRVEKVSQGRYTQQTKYENLEEEMIDGLLGFTKVFRLLVSLKTPIIGHNILTDLALMAHSFEAPLPHSYKKFKRFLNDLFPTVYDTKTVSYRLRNSVPEEKRWKKNLLEDLYVFFKDGDGRHLALNSPYIEMSGKIEGGEQFHNAGFDSYCTGYIFIRMAHIFASKGNNSAKQTFMSGQLLNAVSEYKNCLNVIRGAIAYLQLDGDDPASTRPPWLVVESLQNKPFDLSQVSRILSNYGCVEIKPLERGRRAIVAVDNFGSARRILSQFKARDDFRIKQYNVLQHSLAARTAVWSGVIASSLLVIWLAHSALSK